MVKFLQERAKADPVSYLSFFSEFGQFIKEGVCSDFELKGEAAKLLRFETTAKEEGEMVSLDDYISRMVPEQVRGGLLLGSNSYEQGVCCDCELTGGASHQSHGAGTSERVLIDSV